jgi:hypothetical protein
LKKNGKKNSTPNQKGEFEKNWASLVAELENNLHNDPSSTLGITLGKKCMELINSVYGKKYAHLRTKKFEKGFGEGKGLEEVGLTLETVSWLDKAIDAYWHDRVYGILDQVGQSADEIVLALWDKMLDDMYGEDSARKKSIYGLALNDDKVSIQAKKWLEQVFKSSQTE